jgi:hypothetical protein
MVYNLSAFACGLDMKSKDPYCLLGYEILHTT